MNLRRTLWGSWTQKTSCPISRRPDSSLHGLCWVSNGRLKQLTIKGGTAKKSAETRFTGPQKLIKMRSLSAWDPAHALNSVKLLSRVWLFVTPWIAAHQASLFSTNSRSLPKLMPIELVMPSSPSHLLSSPSPPALNPSQHQGLFQWINSSNEVAKILKLQLQHQSFQWTPRTDLL